MEFWGNTPNWVEMWRTGVTPAVRQSVTQPEEMLQCAWVVSFQGILISCLGVVGVPADQEETNKEWLRIDRDSIKLAKERHDRFGKFCIAGRVPI